MVGRILLWDKLFISVIIQDSNVFQYITQTKYLGFMFNMNAPDGEVTLKQMHALYV